MTANQLLRAGKQRKCVVGFPWSRHTPAAFVLSMQFWRVMEFLPKLKVYKPKKK